MATRNKKNRAFGIAGTVIFHGFLLFVFIYFGLSTPLPLPDEEGVEVNLGSYDQGTGVIQQMEPAPSSPVQPVPVPEPPAEDQEEMITQDIEEAPVIEEKVREEKKEKEKEPEPVEEKIIEKEPEAVKEEPQVDPRALYKGRTTSGTEGSNEGTTGEPGDQGELFGTPDAQNHSGPGGAGDGISYSLGGRGAMHLPKPEYTSKEQGRVVVTIWVDRSGKVVKAVTGAKGTNIADLQLREMARQAALRSTFAPDPNAQETQMGTITYNFIRLN